MARPTDSAYPAEAMKPAPTLGELALQARLLDRHQLDLSLRHQRQNYLEGDFRRLGELFVDHARCSRAAVRRLLLRQGITIVECELCETRYNALLFQGQGSCLRCGRRLVASDEDASVCVEDVISGGSPPANRLLAEHRQRNPRIGRYEILGEVGRGGMGVIYKAWETNLQRPVALKFLRPYDEVSDEDRERFRREAQAIARLRHENIVQAHAIEQVSGLTFMSMDFVEGVALDILTTQRALHADQIVAVAARIADALHYAHGLGILHRDVKPANIVIDRRGKPYLVDFGIAKSIRETVSLTTEGEVLGSLAYMAPEYVARGKAALDHRCDVYGLGVVLYESLSAGKLPYGDPDDDMMIMRLVKEQPIPIEEVCSGINPSLAKIVNRAIAKDREVRHPSAEALAESLDAFVQERMASESGRQRLAAPPPERQEEFDRGGEMEVEPEPEPPPAPEAPREGRGLVVFLAFAVIALAAGWAITAYQASRTVEHWKRSAGHSELKAAEALEAGGELRGAEEAYGRAAELLPHDPAPLEARARLREKRGDGTGAADDRAAAEARRR
jgi:predicted Ser/Thr protein kinase